MVGGILAAADGCELATDCENHTPENENFFPNPIVIYPSLTLFALCFYPFLHLFNPFNLNFSFVIPFSSLSFKLSPFFSFPSKGEI